MFSKKNLTRKERAELAAKLERRLEVHFYKTVTTYYNITGNRQTALGQMASEYLTKRRVYPTRGTQIDNAYAKAKERFANYKKMIKVA